MSKALIEKMAEDYGLPKNIGKKIKATSTHQYRHDEIAEIVGWSVLPIPSYHIRYDNGECDVISLTSIKENSFSFVD